MKRADTLVVGLGSIGQRHARLLTQMDRSVATVSRRAVGDHPDLDHALARTSPDYVVVANETSAHLGTLASLAKAEYRGRVLVEKPLFASHTALPRHAFVGCFVGYNLRFHPVLVRMRELLGDQEVLEAAAYVGQFLPDWRPGRDYRTTASAGIEAGGGVLRDLSHELDYLLWLFGSWRRVASIVLKSGSLGIATDDVATILMECAHCAAVTVHLNYHHRPKARTLTVNTVRHTYTADLVRSVISIDGVDESFPVAPDDTYRAMHSAIINVGSGACPVEDGLAVVELIDAIERASASHAWVGR